MDFTGEYKVPASRDKVWEALNDVDVLKLCIDGCEELNKDSDTEFSAKVTAKVGPVRAKFTGKVTLSDIDPPNGYTISGEGQGGVAGFAKGGAIVKLVDGDGATILHYEAKAEVGGKLASVGSRLVEGVAKKTADDFFGKFVEIVSDGDVDPASEVAEAEPDGKLADSGHEQTISESGGLSPMVWGVGIVAIVAILLIIFGN
tara:strand:- start:480 stop:1085 length:606 start_codon:yes stop_codon:yes gene_type:complete